VLRFARRVNEALAPLKLRLDNLEMLPAAGGAGAGAAAGATPAGGGAVSFRLF